MLSFVWWDEQGETMKHNWCRDDNGNIVMQSLGGLHDGPVCVRCGKEYCRHCVRVGADGEGRSMEVVLDEECGPSQRSRPALPRNGLAAAPACPEYR